MGRGLPGIKAGLIQTGADHFLPQDRVRQDLLEAQHYGFHLVGVDLEAR